MFGGRGLFWTFDERNMRDEASEGRWGLVRHSTNRRKSSFNSTSKRYHTHPKLLPFPSRHVHLRGASEDKYSLVEIHDSGQSREMVKILEEVEFSRALFEIYEGAVVRGYIILWVVSTVTFLLVHSSRFNIHSKYFPKVLDIAWSIAL
jgi:hypothetical protein